MDILNRLFLAIIIFWIILVIILLPIATLLRYEKEAEALTLCQSLGMERLEFYFGHGKNYEIYYMCRDNAGLIYAVPEVSK